MKKLFCIITVFVMVFLYSVPLFAQHTVNDIAKYEGWYKVRIEIFQYDKILFFITQCYPSGEEYDVVGAEREKLPLSLKVLSIGMIEDSLKNSFDFKEMTFNEHGFFMQLTSFSFTCIFKFSKTETELLKELGDEMVNKYRHKKWP
jgi:hypothetical protein